MQSSKETQPSGVRSVCDLGFRTTPSIGSESEWIDVLEPGDILVGRNGKHPVSQIISSLDGYWSHSAIYVGEGRIVHAYSEGVAEWPIEELVSHYDDGLGTARPNREPQERAAAAVWAQSVAATHKGAPPPKYSGRDLGMAYAMLRRARAGGGVHALPDLDLQNVKDWGMLEGLDKPFSSTCSGLVYQAYSRGAQRALKIIPAPGLHIDGDRLIYPRDPELYEELTQPDDGLEAIPRPNWTAWVAMTKIVAGAAAGWLSLQPNDDSINIEQGVSPGDLWSSPHVSKRQFLLPEHRKIALDALKDCPDEQDSHNESIEQG